MNENKNCAQEIRQVKVPNWHFPQLALPPTGASPNSPSPQAKIPQLPVHRLASRVHPDSQGVKLEKSDVE